MGINISTLFDLYKSEKEEVFQVECAENQAGDDE